MREDIQEFIKEEYNKIKLDKVKNRTAEILKEVGINVYSIDYLRWIDIVIYCAKKKLEDKNYKICMQEIFKHFSSKYNLKSKCCLVNGLRSSFNGKEKSIQKYFHVNYEVLTSKKFLLLIMSEINEIICE